MHISKIDLNLLVVLDAIYTERGITPASRKLNLTQPAVSHALARLREALGDPLFVRAGRAMAPTALARNLIEPVRGSLRDLEIALNRFGQFDPASMARRFNVGLRGSLELTVLPPLMRCLTTSAPLVEITTLHVERRRIETDLATGAMDVAIDVALPPLGESVRHRHLMSDRLVVLARPGHPAVRHGRIDLQTYLKQSHIVVTTRRHAAAFEDLELSRLGLRRSVRLHAQHYTSACEVVANSDFVLTILERYAQVANRAFGNQVVALPLTMPPIQFHLYWHDTTESDSANQWLREQLLQIGSELQQPATGDGKLEKVRSPAGKVRSPAGKVRRPAGKTRSPARKPRGHDAGLTR